MTTTGGRATSDSGATYTKTGIYGTATLTTATGVVSYALNNADTDTNALAGGASVSDNFTVYVKDGSTGIASTAVNFAITGTNDNPIANATSKSLTDTSATQADTIVSTGTGGTGVLAGRQRPGYGRYSHCVSGDWFGWQCRQLRCRYLWFFEHRRQWKLHLYRQRGIRCISSGPKRRTDVFSFTVSDGHERNYHPKSDIQHHRGQ